MCVSAISFVSCGSKDSSQSTDESDNAPNKTYLLRILNEFCDSLPKVYFEDVDIVSNDTIRHAKVMHAGVERYVYSVDYEYCVLDDVVENDTVWFRTMILGLDKSELYHYIIDYKREHRNDAIENEFVIKQNSDGDSLFGISAENRNFDYRVYFYNYINVDSIRKDITYEVKAKWNEINEIVKHNRQK